MSGRASRRPAKNAILIAAPPQARTGHRHSLAQRMRSALDVPVDANEMRAGWIGRRPGRSQVPVGIERRLLRGQPSRVIIAPTATKSDESKNLPRSETSKELRRCAGQRQVEQVPTLQARCRSAVRRRRERLPTGQPPPNSELRQTQRPRSSARRSPAPVMQQPARRFRSSVPVEIDDNRWTQQVTRANRNPISSHSSATRTTVGPAATLTGTHWHRAENGAADDDRLPGRAP